MITRPPLPARLGPSLRRWRTLNRVKQAALAADLGVSQAMISRWEAGLARPEGRHASAVMALLTARAGSAADRALLRLVRGSAEPVHLICDLTHRLLAASPARAATWRAPVEDLLGTPLWRFASDGIAEGEAQLAARGWYEPAPEDVEVYTERADFAELTIRAGVIRYARLPLSEGGFARLISDGARQAPA